MPTVKDALGSLNEMAGTALENAFQHPRTTISGTLSFLIGAIPTFLALGLIHGKLASILFSIVGPCKLIWAAFFMKDSGQVLAKVPGVAEPQMVPSHENPDDPKDKAVIPHP